LPQGVQVQVLSRAPAFAHRGSDAKAATLKLATSERKRATLPTMGFGLASQSSPIAVASRIICPLSKKV
jgi:hypothetical protein